jgi:hypothetical protein
VKSLAIFANIKIRGKGQIAQHQNSRVGLLPRQ